MLYNIEYSSSYEVNTDPQRRCYYGVHTKSEVVRSKWRVMEYNVNSSIVEERLKFWNELNDYAVSQRGPSARTYYRKVLVS